MLFCFQAFLARPSQQSHAVEVMIIISILQIQVLQGRFTCHSDWKRVLNTLSELVRRRQPCITALAERDNLPAEKQPEGELRSRCRFGDARGSANDRHPEHCGHQPHINCVNFCFRSREKSKAADFGLLFGTTTDSTCHHVMQAHLHSFKILLCYAAMHASQTQQTENASIVSIACPAELAPRITWSY